MNLLRLDSAMLKCKQRAKCKKSWTCSASDDLNPVYYAVWGVLQKIVYHYRNFKCVQELKSAILSQQLSQVIEVILDRSIGEWRRCLENVGQCNGGHIKHVC